MVAYQRGEAIALYRENIGREKGYGILNKKV